MSCSGASSFPEALDAMSQALANQEFINAFTCVYANATAGMPVLGTLVWFTVCMMSFLRTGSYAMPVVFTLLFGGAALSQVATPVLGFASLLLVGGLALMALLITRRIETP